MKTHTKIVWQLNIHQDDHQIFYSEERYANYSTMEPGRHGKLLNLINSMMCVNINVGHYMKILLVQ